MGSNPCRGRIFFAVSDVTSKIADAHPAASIQPVAHSIPGLDPDFVPEQWSEDNQSVYGYVRGKVPTPVYKINLTTGVKTLVEEVQPETTTGVVKISPVVVSRDGSRFVYSYYQVLSVLYVISGLH